MSIGTRGRDSGVGSRCHALGTVGTTLFVPARKSMLSKSSRRNDQRIPAVYIFTLQLQLSK